MTPSFIQSGISSIFGGGSSGAQAKKTNLRPLLSTIVKMTISHSPSFNHVFGAPPVAAGKAQLLAELCDDSLERFQLSCHLVQRFRYLARELWKK
jgi:hypothetical protein